MEEHNILWRFFFDKNKKNNTRISRINYARLKSNQNVDKITSFSLWYYAPSDIDWYVLTSQGLKEFTERVKGSEEPTANIEAFYETDNPKTVAHDTATDTYVFHDEIALEATEITKQKLQEIEREFMQKHNAKKAKILLPKFHKLLNRGI